MTFRSAARNGRSPNRDIRLRLALSRGGADADLRNVARLGERPAEAAAAGALVNFGDDRLRRRAMEAAGGSSKG